jgi:hypothetical protein
MVGGAGNAGSGLEHVVVRGQGKGSHLVFSEYLMSLQAVARHDQQASQLE